MDLNKDGEAVILTMILLNNKRIAANNPFWQGLLETNNKLIDKDSSLTPDEKANKKLTTNDLIALMWNGIGGVLSRLKDENQYVTIDDNNSGTVDDQGNAIKDGTSYARNVRTYKKEFFTDKQDTSSRNRVIALNSESQENTGKICTVLFMPSAFRDNKVNTKADIDMLTEILKNKPEIKQSKIQALIDALENGYLCIRIRFNRGRGGINYRRRCKQNTSKSR